MEVEIGSLTSNMLTGLKRKGAPPRNLELAYQSLRCNIIFPVTQRQHLPRKLWYPPRSRLLSRASLRLRTALQSRLARKPPKRRSRHDSSRPRGLMYPVHEHSSQRRFRFASQKKPLHSSFPRSIPCCTQSRPKLTLSTSYPCYTGPSRASYLRSCHIIGGRY